jgi:hypothetical protein
MSAELREVLEPLLKEIESLNERIKEYDARMDKIARESYPQVAPMWIFQVSDYRELVCELRIAFSCLGSPQ